MKNVANDYFNQAKLNMHNYETVTQPLFDVLEYPCGGGSLRFFDLPIGSQSKTWAETNMQISNCLPYGQAFIVQSVSLKLLLSRPTLRDERKFYSKGQFSFVIGSKLYLTGTPGELDPRQDPEIRIAFNVEKDGHLSIVAATADSETKGFVLEPNNLLLIPQQFFCLECQQLPRLGSAAKLKATLYGQLMRLIQ